MIVTCNIRRRDIVSCHRRAEGMRENVKLPPSYSIAWSGNSSDSNPQPAVWKFSSRSPYLLFILLFITFGAVRDTLLVYTGAPLALTGGILAILIREFAFHFCGRRFHCLQRCHSPQWVVIVTFINSLRRSVRTLIKPSGRAHSSVFAPFSRRRLVASLGFLPMALAHGRRAEVQRPLDCRDRRHHFLHRAYIARFCPPSMDSSSRRRSRP